ncbi:MAG: tRNA (adenosine(37)-N6)-dimethylallyltransferase MiaA [Longimicrobiales bacterium]
MTPKDRDTPSFLALVGPTASGKTALSLALARRLEVEIISMDSRQVYRGMDVGTGKATPEEQARVRHHGLDLRDPDQRYSAGSFSRDARKWMAEILGRGRVPLLVGGTGFFLKALTHPMFLEPRLDRGRMMRLRKYLNTIPLQTLREFFRSLDPELGDRAAQVDRQRLTRAVEMALLTGRPLSWWHREAPPSREPLGGVILVLEHPREDLYARIDTRVVRMVEEEGLVDEVRGLLEAGYGPEAPGMTGAGYREALAHLRGELDKEGMVEEIQRSHRRYARRQITWFRHQLPEGAIPLDATRPQEEMVEEILAHWKRRTGGGREEGSDGKRDSVEDESGTLSKGRTA